MVALAVAAGLASLGAWQLRRAQFKTELLDRIASAERSPVAAFSMTNAEHFRNVIVTGDWIAARALALDNQLQQGRPGVRWYVPIKTTQGSILLVDLGWQMRSDRSVPLTLPPLPDGELSGVLLPPPGAGLMLGADAPGWPKLVTRLDFAQLEPYFDAPLLNSVLELKNAQSPSIRAELLPPERHRGYAVQWFGLSLAVLVIYLTLALRGRRKSHSQ